MKHSPQSRLVKKMSLAFRRYVTENAPARYYACTFGAKPSDIRKFTELQFENGMSWENYGTWDFDHIVPVDLFSFTDPKDADDCFHFLNTRPLPKAENRRKGASLGEALIEISLRLKAWPGSAVLASLRTRLESKIEQPKEDKYARIASVWSVPDFKSLPTFVHTVRGSAFAS